MLNVALLVLAATPGVYDPIFHNEFEGSDTCQPGLQQYADIGYTGDGIDDAIRYHVDVTQWENIWGHSSTTDPPVPWPGRIDSAPIILNFGKYTYIAAQYQVPSGTPPTWFGWIEHTEYNYGADLTGSISTSCGDFSPSAQACFIETTSGQSLVPWRTQAGNFCPLTPGTYYYLNLMITDPSAPSSTCSSTSSTCAIGTANAFIQ